MTESSSSRPPIGIEPEYIWKINRLHELVSAAGRYIDAGMPVNFEWYLEMRNLIDYLNNRRKPIKITTTTTGEQQ